MGIDYSLNCSCGEVISSIHDHFMSDCVRFILSHAAHQRFTLHDDDSVDYYVRCSQGYIVLSDAVERYELVCGDCGVSRRIFFSCRRTNARQINRFIMRHHYDHFGGDVFYVRLRNDQN